ncbi:retrovirus-related pol polyprotein from transposon TNT 1-94 [Tanacetum coccineum]
MMGFLLVNTKYVDEILKMNGFSTMKTASTPMETLKSLMNDENAEDVDVHLYRSMIGSLMYLTSSRPDIMKSTIGGCQFLGRRLISWQCKKQTIVANSTTEADSKSTAWNEFGTNIASAVICLVKNQKFNFSKLIFDGMLRHLDPNSKKFLMYPRFLQLLLNNQIENLTPTFNDEYDTPSQTKKVFANMRRQGKDFSGTVTQLFATILIQPQADVGEGLRQPSEPQHTPTTALPSNIEPIPIIASSSQPQKTHKHRKTKRPTEISQSSGPTTLVADETVHEERGDNMERAATTAASLDADQDNGNKIRTQSMATLNEPIPQGTGLGSGPRRQDIKLGDKPAQTRLRALENVKTAQDLEITSLKKRVKKLEKKKKARTPQLKRRLFKVRIEASTEKSLGDQEDASKQGRNKDQDDDISWFQEDVGTQGRYDQDIDITTASALITTTGVFVSTAEPSTPPTTTVIKDEDLTIAQTLMKMRSEKSKEKEKERGSKENFSEPATRPTRGVTMQEPKVAKRLVEELEAELAEEERVAIQKEEEANLISWDNTQAMMEADYELAQRLQAKRTGRN